MSKEDRLEEFDRKQHQRFTELEEKLINDYQYRVNFLKNPKSFVEAEAGIEVDDDLMRIIWESVRKLTDQNGQPREGQLGGFSLD